MWLEYSSPIIFSPTVNTPTHSAGDVNDVASTGEVSTSESGENGEVSSYFQATYTTSVLSVAFRL